MRGRLGFCLGVAAICLTAAAPVRADDPPAVTVPPITATEVTTAPATEPSATEILTATPTIRLRGRIEVDAIMPAQSAASRAQLGTLEGGFGFRRARIGAEGEIDHSSNWIAEFDFAGGTVHFRDVYVGLTALPVVREARVGYFREPFSLEGQTSSRFITFMERSTINQFDPARDWGVGAYWYPESERMTAAAGLFRNDTSSDGVSTGNGNGWAITGRVTGLPVYDDDPSSFRLAHIGGAISLRQPDNNQVDYKPAPQNNLLTVTDNPVSPLLPNVVIPAKSQQLYNLQAAAVYGPLSFQAEWTGTTIQQPGAGVVFFHGAYAFVSWFPTGEHRGYNLTRASFDQVSVRRPLTKDGYSVSGCGAIELAWRFSYTDFTSPNFPPQQPANAFGAITGARLYESTWGVNWYFNDYTRIMANYTYAIPASPGSPVYPVHTFGIRTAIFW